MKPVSRAFCNEDSPGGDELYSRARAREESSNPRVGFWSEWTNSKTVSYDC
jgi:hypothetical protein